MIIRVQETPFDFGAEAELFTQAQNDMGAIVTFSGIVRNTDQRLQKMVIEHYPVMTEKALKKIAKDAMDRWSLGGILIIHRYGDLRPNEMIMMVATAASHRKDAFEAATFLMDYLKSRAPFWKKEITESTAQWVAAKDSDEDALEEWQIRSLSGS